MKQPFIIPKEDWIDKYGIVYNLGQVQIGRYLYTLVDYKGSSMFDSFKELTEYQRRKIIERLDTADLVRIGCLPMYKNLGHDRFIEIVSQESDSDDEIIEMLRKEAQQIIVLLEKKKKEERKSHIATEKVQTD